MKPGTNGHIIGTDETGYDLLARIMRGTQRDFEIIIIATVDRGVHRASSSAPSPGTSARSPTTC